MDILEKCRKWHESGEYQRIVDALEGIPEENRTPETDSELARALNNLADPNEQEGRAMLRRAIDLLKPHEEYFGGDHVYNYRMGYAYYFLDREETALPYFERALEARPGDEDTEKFIHACKQNLSMPTFEESFAQRTKKAWELFCEREGELRRIMDEDKKHERGEELVAKCGGIFETAFDRISFEMGGSKEKPEIILSPEGNKVKLFELEYFRRHAPEKALDKWSILVGRQPSKNMGLRFGKTDINGDDVRVWYEKSGEKNIELTLYCEKLGELYKSDENRVWWALCLLLDQVLGEINNMRYVNDVSVVDAPLDKPSVSLSELPGALSRMGLELTSDPEAYLESYTAYHMEPDGDENAEPRLDIITGSTCCPAFINEYLGGGSQGADSLYTDGAAAGFIHYSLDSFDGEGKERSNRIFDFRDELERALEEKDDAFTFLGGATGIYNGYIDFIAWDLPEVLSAAKEFFAGKGIKAYYHSFRRDAFSVPLFDDNDDDDIKEPGEKGGFTGFVLLSKAEWDKKMILNDLKKEWDIVPNEAFDELLNEDDEESRDNLIFTYNGMTAVMGLMPMPIPGGEAEECAKNNYLWRDAVKAAKAHKAHILVAVLGKDVHILERARLYTKLLSVCCLQKRAAGVYTSGVVYEPMDYKRSAEVMKRGMLPMMNLVWVGLYRGESGMCGYTYGLGTFGKDEIEVLDANVTSKGIDNFVGFIYSIAEYVLMSDVELKDGETIGFSENDKHSITRSEGAALPGMTLKISFSPQ